MCLLGCSAALPPSAVPARPRERLAINAAIRSWELQGLPWSATCVQELPRIHVVVSGPEEFTALCGRPPVHGGGTLYACSTEQFRYGFPRWLLERDRIPLLVISRLQPVGHRRLLIIHETMHWLERCSGKGVDFEHADMRVWQDARLLAERMLLSRGIRFALHWGEEAPARTQLAAGL